MKIEAVLANPAGNRTAMVLSAIQPGRRAEIAEKIMALEKHAVEQVGFLVPPLFSGAARLEMMGGEFCGNAVRSLGMYAAARTGLTAGRVLAEISGAAAPLPVQVDRNTGTASVLLPGGQRLDTLPWEDGTLPAVILDGIVHIIASGMAAGRESAAQILKAARTRYDVPALGVLFLADTMDRMQPVVWVRDTDSVIFESSCASGSAAAAVYRCASVSDGEREFVIRQPGGAVTARVCKAGGTVASVEIGGSVSLSQPITLDLGGT